jgi:hypothetical protein
MCDPSGAEMRVGGAVVYSWVVVLADVRYEVATTRPSINAR